MDHMPVCRRSMHVEATTGLQSSLSNFIYLILKSYSSSLLYPDSFSFAIKFLWLFPSGRLALPSPHLPASPTLSLQHTDISLIGFAACGVTSWVQLHIGCGSKCKGKRLSLILHLYKRQWSGFTSTLSQCPEILPVLTLETGSPKLQDNKCRNER